MVNRAWLGAALASPALAQIPVQGFESIPTGTEYVTFEEEDSGFGYFTGGMVAEPGVTVGTLYLLAGSKVYYGTDIFFTTYYADDYHCCGYGRHEMLLTAPGGVEVIFYGHGSDWVEQVEIHREILTGFHLHYGWGEPIIFDGENFSGADITSIRWVSVDGTPFAIDDFTAKGIAVIPEPATWAMLIAGFGLVGSALRRRQVVLPA